MWYNCSGISAFVKELASQRYSLKCVDFLSSMFKFYDYHASYVFLYTRSSLILEVLSKIAADDILLSFYLFIYFIYLFFICFFFSCWEG